jgi:long-chain acyl-CoA synthetase
VSKAGDMLPLAQRLWVIAAGQYLSGTVPFYHLPNAISLRVGLERGAKLKMQTVAVKPEDLALLQYTGGTTGPARGAMLSYRNLTANLEQIAAWHAQFLKRGEESIIMALPLYHIVSLTANCLTFMKWGDVNYLITDPRNLRGFVRALKNVPFTAITGANTLFKGLLGTRGFSPLDFLRLKVSLAGGMALQESVASRWKAIIGSTLIEAYGVTEASPAACVNPLDLAAYNACIGLRLPSTEVCIQNDSGHLLGPRIIGELCIRGRR